MCCSQIDDLVLAVARRDGTRDGATALVVLRLGGVLYSAHAGDSRAVLCRDGHAHRLTEDHKPHLPQVGAGGWVGSKGEQRLQVVRPFCPAYLREFVCLLLQSSAICFCVQSFWDVQ